MNNTILLTSGELVEIDNSQLQQYIKNNLHQIQVQYIGGFDRKYNTGLHLLHKSGKLILFNRLSTMIDYVIDKGDDLQVTSNRQRIGQLRK